MNHFQGNANACSSTRLPCKALKGLRWTEMTSAINASTPKTDSCNSLRPLIQGEWPRKPIALNRHFCASAPQYIRGAIPGGLAQLTWTSPSTSWTVQVMGKAIHPSI